MRSIEAAFLVDDTGATLAGATEVWLIRHGDCYEGVKEEDPGLSPRGREQARLLGERLRRLRFDACYVSPMRRARETAAAVTADVLVEERLVEVQTELEDGYVRPVELPDAVLARMTGAVTDAVAAHEGGRVAMFGHALSIMSSCATCSEWSSARCGSCPTTRA
jgi:broad specificity phosphatase PhoE